MSEEQASEFEYAGPKEIVKAANEWLHPLQPYAPRKALREMTRRIMALDKGKIKMSANEAAHLAQVSAASQLNPFMDEVWGWVSINKKGERAFTIMPGRRGILRHAHEQARLEGIKFWPEYRLIDDPEERKRRHIPEGALAYECRLRDSGAMEAWQKAMNTAIDALKVGLEIDRKSIGPMPFIPGIGILTKEEIQALDRNYGNKMSHEERTQKRAYMAALKQRFDIPLGGAIGGAGDTMDDYIYEGEWEVVEEDEDKSSDEEKEEIKAKAEEGKEILFDNGGDEPKPIKFQWSNDALKQLREKIDYFPNNAAFKRIQSTIDLTPFHEGDPIEWIKTWFEYYAIARKTMETSQARQTAMHEWAIAYANDKDAISRMGKEAMERWTKSAKIEN